MASSYVEVRESENGTEGSMLQFEINPCESNGIDVPSHIDGEPPKDHTYNKDPEVVEEVIHEPPEEVDEPEEKKEASPEVKKSSRNAKNTKQKTSKLRTVEKPVKSPVKKETSKKIARIKITAERQDTEAKAEEKEKVPEEPQVDLLAKGDSVENESLSSVSSPVKKRNRKRKGEENPSEEVDAKQIKITDAESDSEKVEVNADKKEEVNEEEEEEKEKEEVKENKPEKPEKKSKVPKEKPQKPAKETKVKNTKKEKKEEPVKATPKPKPAPAKKAKDTGTPDASLPDGWTRKIVERKSGKTAGMIDIYIYSPDGIKFRSRPDIAAYLTKIKSNLKVEDFNFTKRGLVGSTAAVKPTANKKKPVSKVEEKAPAKVVAKPKKKSSHGGSNSVGKKGQKLLVKLNVSTPKKRMLSNSENQKGAKKSKPDETKSATSSKGAGGSRRKK